MSWRPNHPGGELLCDAGGCQRKRRVYCSPQEADTWTGVQLGPLGPTRDFCPAHNTTDRQVDL